MKRERAIQEKGKWLCHFIHNHIIEEISGYYKCKIDTLLLNCTVCQNYYFNTGFFFINFVCCYLQQFSEFSLQKNSTKGDYVMLNLKL